MIKFLEIIKYTPIYEAVLPISLRLEVHRWHKRKKTPPTPQLIKHQMIREVAKKYSINTLVETGTYLGTMINANKKYFNKIYTIELNKKLYERAKRKFSKFHHIKVKQGDSAKILPEVLKKIKNPTIFWLDAHFSGGITSKGESETPIIAELRMIIKTKLNHILLVDDALEFNGQNDYPDMKKVKDIILKGNSNYRVFVKNNIIHIIPDKLH